jgi:protease I
MAMLLFVIAPTQFNDIELNETRRICQEAGHLVTIASTQAGDAFGMHGHVEPVMQTLQLVESSDYDALIIIGGYGAIESLWDNVMLHDLVHQFDEAQKLLGAICVSPVVLAKAGMLRGKPATVWQMPETLEAFREAEISYVGEQPVVEVDRFVTANAPEASTAFGSAIVGYLKTYNLEGNRRKPDSSPYTN